MYTCTTCGAPLHGIFCTYCGARSQVDLSHRYDVHKETERVCPACDVYLETIAIDEANELYIEQCKHCDGIFLDYGELEALMERHIVTNGKVEYAKLRQILDNPLAPRQNIHYKKCPECRNTMSRYNYKQKSGVIIDRCIAHGFWLDSGELRQIMEWAKLSGLENFIPTYSDIPFTTDSTAKIANKPIQKRPESNLLDVFIDGLFRTLYGH